MAGKPRKKVEPIIGMADENKLTVQKSVPLHALWKSELTLAEFKILDMYLSRIDSHKPERRQIKLSKGEVEQALGVKKISTQDLKARLKHLMGNVVEVQDKDMKKGFRLVTLFDEAVAEQDSNGLWEVRLECTQKAMKYFFNIESLGYFRYKLRCVTSMTSRYTYIMFSYLEAHRRMGLSWEVSLDELKRILACDQEETYKEYKHFNNLLLKKVHKELHEKTECRYSYEPIKKGRSVVSVRFTLETIADLLPDPEELDGQQHLPWFDVPANSPLSFLSEACDNEFSPEQMQEILSIISTKTIDQLPVVPSNPGDIEFSRYHYLSQMYARMNVQASKEKISHRYDYFLAMLKRQR